MTRNEINPRCPIHDTMLNAAGDCLLCDHPELDPDGLTAEQAQKELDAIPDRPLTPEELAEIDEVVARAGGALVTPRGLPRGAGEVRGCDITNLMGR